MRPCFFSWCFPFFHWDHVHVSIVFSPSLWEEQALSLCAAMHILSDDSASDLLQKWLPGSAKKPESTPEDKVTPSAPLLSPARDDDLDEDDEDGFLISPHDSPAGHTSKVVRVLMCGSLWKIRPLSPPLSCPVLKVYFLCLQSHGRGVKWSRQRRASKPSHGEVIVDMILARSQRTSKVCMYVCSLR